MSNELGINTCTITTWYKHDDLVFALSRRQGCDLDMALETRAHYVHAA
jgi:hypothetical protein